jgi:solute carrier family 25 protein 39/40
MTSTAPSPPAAPPPLPVRLASATLGALATALLTTPFEVVKTRQQSAAPPRATSVAQAVLALCRRPLALGRAAAYQRAQQPCMPACACDTAAVASSTASASASASASSAPGAAAARSALGAAGGASVSASAAARAGALATMLAVARLEGVPALWSGLAPSLLMSLPSTALYFAAYDELRHALEASPRLRGTPAAELAPLIAGVVARSLAATAVSPLELLRTRAMMHRRSELSLLETARDEVRRGGVASLWRGLGPTLARDVPFSGLYWLGYERLKRWGAGGSSSSGGGGGGGGGGTNGGGGGGGAGAPSPAVSFLSGLTAGSFAALITTPFDVIKTRRQVRPAAGAAAAADAAGAAAAAPLPRVGTLAALRTLAREEGLAGLWSGGAMRVARVGPACAIMITSCKFPSTNACEAARAPSPLTERRSLTPPTRRRAAQVVAPVKGTHAARGERLFLRDGGREVVHLHYSRRP